MRNPLRGYGVDIAPVQKVMLDYDYDTRTIAHAYRSTLIN